MAEKKRFPKVVLIQVSGALDNYWGFYPPLGLASVATYSMEYGKLPRKNILILDSNLPHVKKIVKAFNPDIIGFSTFSNNYLSTVQLANDLKFFSPNAILILGGVHLSIFPETLDPVFDFGVLKEGEDTFLDILSRWEKIKNLKDKTKELKKIKGIVFDNGKGIISTPERDLVNPLDKIPPIDWTLFSPIFFRREVVKDNETNEWKDYKVFPLFTSRGCPYHCVFCARSALWKVVRYFSPERVGDDIEALRRKFGVVAIQIWDDLFTISVPRLKQIEEQLEKRKLLGETVFYRVFARSDLFSPEMVAQLKRLNVKSVAFGLESGSERILKYLKKNTTNVEKNYGAVDLCEKEKMGFVACMMMGIPTETDGDMADTLNFVKYIYSKETLEVIDMARATPFPGTELYDYAMKEKLLPESFFQLSKSLSLNNVENDKPLLIKDKLTIKSYQKHWKKVKSYENTLWQNNTKQRGYKISMFRVNLFNSIDRKLFIPNMLLDQAMRGNGEFFLNIGKLGIGRVLKRWNSDAKKS